jgi:hypothetical protein
MTGTRIRSDQQPLSVTARRRHQPARESPNAPPGLCSDLRDQATGDAAEASEVPAPTAAVGNRRRSPVGP